MRAVKFEIIGSLLCSTFPRDGIASDRKVGLWARIFHPWHTAHCAPNVYIDLNLCLAIGMFCRSTSPSASKTSEQKGEETSRERADSSQQSPRQSVIVPVIFGGLVVVGNRNFAFKSGSSQFWVQVFLGPPDPCPETIRNMSGTSLQSGSIKKKRRLERRILRKRKPGARQVCT